MTDKPSFRPLPPGEDVVQHFSSPRVGRCTRRDGGAGGAGVRLSARGRPIEPMRCIGPLPRKRRRKLVRPQTGPARVYAQPSCFSESTSFQILVIPSILHSESNFSE